MKREIVLIGLGHIYKAFMNHFDSDKANIIALLDNDPNLQGKIIGGIEVQSVENAHKFVGLDFVITTKCKEEITAQIQEKVKGSRVYFFSDIFFGDRPFYNDFWRAVLKDDFLSEFKEFEKGYLHILDIVQNRPLDINIEIVEYCPLKCRFCVNRKKNRTYHSMSMDLFGKICEEYSEMGGGGIGLSSMQSDVFSDNQLMNRLRYLNKYKDIFYVYTTTSLISASKYGDREINEILDVFDLMEVSVLGTNPDDYRMMSGIDGYDLLYSTLYRFKNLIDRWNKRTTIVLCFRTTNLHKLKKDMVFQKLANDFGISYSIDTYFDWYGGISQEDLPNGAKLRNPDHSKDSSDCALAYKSLTIKTDGQAVGCGCVDWDGVFVIGDARIQTLREIWNSDDARKFRYGFSGGKIPDICKHCGMYYDCKKIYGQKKYVKYMPEMGVYDYVNL